MADDRIKGIRVNGRTCDLDLSRIGSVVHDTNGGLIGEDTELVEYINNHGGDTPTPTPTNELTSADGTKFLLKVYDDGTLYADEQITGATKPNKPSGDKKTSLGNVDKLYINSFYCGGLDSDDHTLNYCSHNFVELCNLTANDIDLGNMSLQYLKGGSTAWLPEYVFKLSGVIKAGSTFLIRFARCSNIDGAKIVVDDYDLEFPDIKFSIESPAFYLCFGDTPYEGSTTNPGWTGKQVEGYEINSKFIDLVGIKTSIDGSTYVACNAFTNAAYELTSSKKANEVIFRRYYAMDGVSQGNKAYYERSNATEFCYVDLTKDDGDLIPSITANTPKAKIDGKNLYFDKTKLLESKPSMITCSFGIEAVDKEDGDGATRCFNWVSKGRHDEFIWIRKQGTSDWGEAHESFKKGSQGGTYAKYYDRLHIEYNDGVVFTAHKFIKHGLTKGIWEYIAGRANRDGSPILNQCTDVRSFTVRTFNQVKDDFKYIQTSDQQGFKWEEYVIWDAASKTIAKESLSNDVQFMINTGDMTQNGSRMCEWLDYFNGKGNFLNNLEEMATVGNNDLSGKKTYDIPGGKDGTKLSPANFNYFYTYEMNEANPPVFTVEGKEIFVPSLYSFNYGKTHFMCINSEIKPQTETNVFDIESASLYPEIKEWCRKDIEDINTGYSCYLAYCHELPFHIMTYQVTRAYEDDYLYDLGDGSNAHLKTAVERTAGFVNENLVPYESGKGTPRYWSSEFFQQHNIRLVMGGHKHTQTTTWPLLENVTYNNGVRSVRTFRPVIVLENVEHYTKVNNDHLVNAIVNVANGVSFEAKYPASWTTTEGGVTKVIDEQINNAVLCEFIMANEVASDSRFNDKTKPVIYAMSQATSYKHTSNKELPSDTIPWLRYYYPATNYNPDDKSAKANAGQKFPFYTVWTADIAHSGITGEVRKVAGAFDNSGKFDINKDGEYVLKGISAVDHVSPIASVNGLRPDALPDEKIVVKL